MKKRTRVKKRGSLKYIINIFQSFNVRKKVKNTERKNVVYFRYMNIQKNENLLIQLPFNVVL